MTAEQDTLIADGYTRLSQDSDRSIPRQTENIEAYGEKLNSDDEYPPVKLSKIYNDGRWSSGFSTEGRGEWQRVMERIEAGETDMVWADGKRRFARDFDDTMELIMACRKNDVELHDVGSGALDLDDPKAVSFELMQAASEHEAMKRYIEKSIEETKQRISNGYYHGQPPVGLCYDGEKQHLVIDEAHEEDIRVVLELAENGESARRIAEEVPWTHPTVSKILKREEEYHHALGGGHLGHQLKTTV